MILQEATYEAFGYFPRDLNPQSHKPILVACEICGKFRILKRKDYRTLCPVCGKADVSGKNNPMYGKVGDKNHMFGRTGDKAPMFGRTGDNAPMFGKTHTDEAKRKMSKAHKGEKHFFFNKHGSEAGNWQGGKTECKCKTCGKLFYVPHYIIKRGEGEYCSISCSMKTHIGKNHHNFGKRGGEASNWKGGIKMSNKRHSAKRRQLGFTPLNTPFEDVEAHHITHNSVVYIPKALHHSIWHNMHTGQGMAEMNAVAIDFLIRGVI